MKVRRRPRPDVAGKLDKMLFPVLVRRRMREVELTPGATAFSFGECPRCGGMANGMLSNTYEVFAVDCQNCGLPGATSVITIWNVAAKVQAGNHPSDTDEALVMAIRGGVEATIWQGDVLVAHYTPGDDDTGTCIYFYNGRCDTITLF